MCVLFLRGCGVLHKQLLICIAKKQLNHSFLHKRSKLDIFSRHCSFNKRRELDTNTDTKCNVTSMAQTQVQIFQGIPDRYEGLTIDSKNEPCDVTGFPGKLDDSLNHWVSNNVRGIWFKIALQHADWVPILAKKGFTFHHAQSEYVMMYKWLPITEDSNIPNFAHTMIGVGAVVVNNNEEVLVVRERFFVKGFPHYKLPGGYVNAGEDLEEAARREVLEETGIETKFNFVVSFRHTHGVNFGCSDIYFIVCLTPLTQEIKICEREIVECCWMKINDYMVHPQVHEANRFFMQKYLDYKSSGKAISSYKSTHPILKKPYTVFSIGDLNTINNDEEKSKI